MYGAMKLSINLTRLYLVVDGGESALEFAHNLIIILLKLHYILYTV
jgi:hypothetical protein